MKMRIKQYNNYFNKLINYCELMKFKLYVSDTIEDICDLDKKEIVICTKYKREEQIAAALHEIGHLIDYISNKKLYKKAKTYNVLIKNCRELTQHEKSELIKMEIRAWNHGQALADMLCLRIELDAIKKKSLSSYFALKAKTRRKDV